MKVNHVEERRRFISDAFHSLNQPLTGLHCGLEIALQRPRTEGEYRQRISDGVDNAGQILALVKAVRQLVDAADPGERCGTVSLPLVLSQMNSELEVVAEATGVALHMNCVDQASVTADPGKLLSALGGLVAIEMERHEAGAVVSLELTIRKRKAILSVKSVGKRKTAEPDEKSNKLADIRSNAAYSYLWTVGGDYEDSGSSLIITMPLLSA